MRVINDIIFTLHGVIEKKLQWDNPKLAHIAGALKTY
jgi:hypothetical protein